MRGVSFIKKTKQKTKTEIKSLHILIYNKGRLNIDQSITMVDLTYIKTYYRM
jgi:hypothetical protein